MASLPSPSAEAAAPAIRVTDLVFAWGRGRPVIDIPSFAVDRGERIFLKGPSGSGKSTLLGLIGGVLEPASGRLETLGQDLATMPRRQRDRFRAARIGFIFQMFNLLPYLSVLDNVLLPLRFSERRRATLARGGMQPAAEARRLLDALGIPASALGRPATALSHGQQQRVAAARALIGRPDLLIADEPTSSLDADARESFLALLMRECGTAGTTVVFVSHDASLAPLFDRSVDLTDINRAPS